MLIKEKSTENQKAKGKANSTFLCVKEWAHWYLGNQASVARQGHYKAKK